MANPTIGRIKCPFTGEWAEVRKCKTGKQKLYFYSSAGMITPNLPAGQSWIMDNAEIWGEGNEPKPVTETKPVNGNEGEPKPVNEPKPVRKKKSLLEMMLSEDE